ncbi:MAG TPA: RNB domain-containing ribonuclease [Myxococcota bacterium]|nr:RNB domain-containing ribonuclease [Myxococcota bacterium]
MSRRRHDRLDLQRIADRAMRERGLEPEFPREAIAEVDAMPGPAADPSARDLRDLLWSSIDNDDSLDLDQLSAAERGPDGSTAIRVAIADVDALVKKEGAIDRHAARNTTSVYTAAKLYPMLPERLSNDWTSLGQDEDRLALVVELGVSADGAILRSDLYRATVRNHAKLAYDAVSAWLEGAAPPPAPLAAVAGLEESLRWQDAAAQKLRALRHERGALDLETIEARAVFADEEIRDLEQPRKNRARELIEDLMIATNGITARFLDRHGLPTLRRVLRSPERWARIMDVARELGTELPAEPDSTALEAFLLRRKEVDPVRFPDLSLTIVKLMGSGEYAVDLPGAAPIGHFGLAVRDYTHSTAPNRRFPDVITQRMLKAALAGAPPAYSLAELRELALHCTRQEDDATKVERQVRKSAAALLLEGRVGQRFQGIVTGASEKGTWVRVLAPPVEGKLQRGWEGLDVGDRVEVRLLGTDVERGFIDFARVGS